MNKRSDNAHVVEIQAPTATITTMAFNAEGRKLFFWLEGHIMDYVCIYEVDALRKTICNICSLRFSKVSDMKRIRTFFLTTTWQESKLRNHGKSNIWPSNDMSFCVIQQSNGAFLAQAREQRSDEAMTRGVITVKDVVAGLVHDNKLLFCLEDHGRFHRPQLSSYTINRAKDGSWELEADRHTYGKLSREIDTSAGMAIQVSGEVTELVLYSKKRIMRYTILKSRGGSA
jgi:hypothetical protein